MLLYGLIDTSVSDIYWQRLILRTDCKQVNSEPQMDAFKWQEIKISFSSNLEGLNLKNTKKKIVFIIY
jgi:hypothetical protein